MTCFWNSVTSSSVSGCLGSTISWPHKALRGGIPSSFLEPFARFCGEISPKVDKPNEIWPLKYPHEGPGVAKGFGLTCFSFCDCFQAPYPGPDPGPAKRNAVWVSWSCKTKSWSCKTESTVSWCVSAKLKAPYQKASTISWSCKTTFEQCIVKYFRSRSSLVPSPVWTPYVYDPTSCIHCNVLFEQRIAPYPGPAKLSDVWVSRSCKTKSWSCKTKWHGPANPNVKVLQNEKHHIMVLIFITERLNQKTRTISPFYKIKRCLSRGLHWRKIAFPPFLPRTDHFGRW